ncbi:hypothetical protein GCM10010168_69880 [Actinoplanes ianthinogenes]|uniref:Uncharacterized protein n=1 Tax=Actinoplanes ianthinogenes TaxID=122358 RepID=A0ABM7M0S6_9ACTN|nr:hypothetical protein [Actinoplanes ianthinogenes]BCJ45187.1 hypothetical protein Aiant_58440 [Actinoplanes ianthinogenes]GGR41156.1 hypothetical protein GCM10010168_69880 [Actinoplanes ianthinogenes]
MLPPARTRDEAHLYMDLHGCPRCGSVAVAWAESLADADGVLARRYAGACEDCGLDREFLFRLPERATPPAPGESVTFGAADDPSQLFDAGEWVAIADMSTLASGLAELPPDEARESAAIAAACYDEALKFLPAGADRLPDRAFWSVAGREFRQRSPHRFSRDDLIAAAARARHGR